MNENQWKVGEARQQFSEVLRRCEKEAQLIYRRDELIAAVVHVDEAGMAPDDVRLTIADRFEEIRALLREENYRLPAARRWLPRTSRDFEG